MPKKPLARLTEPEKELAESLYPLLVGVARGVRLAMPLADRIQAGFFGVVRAIRNFDESKGCLRAYARRCIRSEILNRSRENTLIRVPHYQFMATDGSTWGDQSRAAHCESAARAMRPPGHDTSAVAATTKTGADEVERADFAEWIRAKLDALPAVEREAVEGVASGDGIPESIKRRGIPNSTYYERSARGLRRLRGSMAGSPEVESYRAAR